MNSLRLIKLRQLECFIETARQGSVTKAALVMNLSQPAVTRSLRELEEAVGHALIEKFGRGIKLTPYGEIYRRYAGESLAALRRGELALEELGAQSGPPLRIGALPTVSARIMPEVLACYLQSSARAPVAITTGENRILLEALRQGELDLVMGRLPAPELMQGLAFEPLYTEKVVFVAASSHPLFHTASISVEEICTYPMLIPSRQSIIRPFVERLFVEQGISPPRQSIETVSDSFGRAFTREHDAVWVISEGVVASEIARGEFRVLPLPTDTTIGSVGLHTNPASKLSASANILIDLIHDIVDAHNYQKGN